MSFYRTYRPQVIEEIDNVAVRNQLLNLLSKEKKQLPHAFLFTGPRGAGKTTAARVIAKLFNCMQPTKQGPCGTCEQCKSIAEGKNLDVLEIDAASNRGIDEMRSLRDAINLAPSSAQFKIYIIDEVHMLTTEAFNALLKTLEEPPAHAVFVLATTDPQKVPATILSRCVNILFHKATSAELLHALTRIVKDEKIDIDTDALSVIADSVDGAFRDGVKLLEQVSFHTGKITADIVRTIISVSDDSVHTNFFDALKKKDTQPALDILTKLASDGKDMKTFLTSSLHLLEKMLIEQVQKNEDSSFARDLIRRFSESYTLMKNSPIPELPLEVAVVEYCAAPISPKPSVSSASSSMTAPQVTQVKKIDPPVSPLPSVAPAHHASEEDKKKEVIEESVVEAPSTPGLLTLEKLTSHWLDFIAELKPHNHSVAGVMHSARPKSVAHGIVTIEAFYAFHKDKLSESKTKDIMITVLKKLFGEKVKVEVVLGKK